MMAISAIVFFLLQDSKLPIFDNLIIKPKVLNNIMMNFIRFHYILEI